MFIAEVALSVSTTTGKLKNCLHSLGIDPAIFVLPFQCSITTELRDQVGSNGCTVHQFFCKLIYLCEFRHRKQRGEVIITVDSCETVRDVKLELMKLFSVMPLDQHLSVDGKVLEDGEILGAAGVRPGSILLLKVSRNIFIGGFQTFPGDCNRAFFNTYTGGAKAPPPSPYVAPPPSTEGFPPPLLLVMSLFV